MTAVGCRILVAEKAAYPAFPYLQSRRPDPGTAAVQVSQDSGTEPLWAPDGRTLYCRDWSRTMPYTVPVIFGSVPQFGMSVVTRGRWSRALPYGRRYAVDAASEALLFQDGRGQAASST